MSLRRRQPFLAVIAAAASVEGWWGQLNTAPARNQFAAAESVAWLPYPIAAPAATNVEGWWGQLNRAPARNLTAVASDAAWLPYPVTAVTYNFAAFSTPQHDGQVVTQMIGY